VNFTVFVLTSISSEQELPDYRLRRVSVSIRVSEVESIVRKAVSLAVTDIKKLINNKLANLDNHISAT